MGYLPANNLERPPARETSDPVDRADSALDSIVPDDPQAPYDMHRVIGAVVDGLATHAVGKAAKDIFESEE